MGVDQGRLCWPREVGKGSKRRQQIPALLGLLLHDLGHQTKGFRFFCWGDADAACCPCHIIGKRVWGVISETSF